MSILSRSMADQKDAVGIHGDTAIRVGQHDSTDNNEMICLHDRNLPHSIIPNLALDLFNNKKITIKVRLVYGWLGVLTLMMVSTLMMTSSAYAGFGVEPGSFTTVATERDGAIDTRAGSHPYEYTVSFKFNLQHNAKGEQEPEGHVRDIIVDLPPGMVGNPSAVPRCPPEDFEGIQSFCPGDTQIGVIHAELKGIGSITSPVFNLVPPVGVPARFGTSINSYNVFEDASVRTGAGYGVAVSANNVPISKELEFATETIWGVPPEKSHDVERQCVGEEAGIKDVFSPCSSEIAPRPFLTLPDSCNGPLSSTINIDSAEDPGDYVSENAFSLDAGGNPIGLFGCESIPFEPSILAQPETGATSSPTGLRFDLHIPQNEEPEGRSSADLESAFVSFPEGMTVNPSAANGLTACTLAQIALSSPSPAACPASSKIGNVEVKTPLLEHPLHGAFYLADPAPFGESGKNPFNSLLAIYIAIYDPITGVVVKQAGQVNAEAGTGRLTVIVKEIPQLPFEDLELQLYGGAHAALSTPATCGTKTIASNLTPWSSTEEGHPAAPSKTPEDTFQTDQDCATPGFTPSLSAGTTNPQAAGSSSFVMTLSRQDDEQDFQGLEETLPPGLLATIKNIPLCAEAQANTGTCEPSSQIGETSAAAGEGEPYWVTGGKIYLTGPYQGTYTTGPQTGSRFSFPFGLSIVVPADAGPFKLGNQIVRAGIEINPHTAQATIKTTTPIPHIIKGIPLYIRTINANINHPGFILNPTNCNPSNITATIESTTNTTTTLKTPFQAANCAALPFKPSFKATTQAKTSKQNGASLTVTVSEKPGESNISKVDLQLPLILPARLTTLQKACTEKQFNTNPAGCPEGSNIGTATATTPILNTPLTGPAYLVSHGGAAFPDVEFVLQGENVTIILDGATDIKKGITYSKFETIPDAPITTFQTILPEGPHSALTSNGNLCNPTKTITTHKHITTHHNGHTKHTTTTTTKTITEPLQIPTTLTAQNGTTTTQNTHITTTNCPKTTTTHTNHQKPKHTKKKTKHA